MLLTFNLWLLSSDPKDFMDMEMPGNNHLLTDKMLQDEDAYVLLKTLANNTYVTGLDFRYNQITDKGAEHIAELLKVSWREGIYTPWVFIDILLGCRHEV